MKNLPVIILAGGLATRLKPLTEKIPKALVEINGRPFIDHQLEILKRNQLDRIILSIAYLGELIEAHVGSAAQYVYDGPSFLGTGGAVKRCMNEFADDSFLVLYGDSYLPYDYQEIISAFNSASYSALMTVYRNEGLFDASNVLYDGEKILRYEKIQDTAFKHIDWGFNVFHRRAFDDFLSRDKFDLSEVFQNALKKKELQAFEVGERFYEIGSKAGIEELENYLRRGSRV